jgi:CubicO group peptidase (beta-lactamase class C family)
MAAGMATDDAWADRHIDASDGEVDAMVAAGATFAWAPHTHGEYSNLGYVMLGRVVHRVSGQRAQDFITENLLHPLGMHRTTWLRPTDDDWARPYDVRDDRRVADPQPLGDGAGAPMSGLWSCVSDLARWVAWLGGAFPARDGDDHGPLCRASRREMQQVARAWPTVRTPAEGEGDDAVPERIDGGGYGFGLYVMHDDRFGHFVHHSGGLPGYGSNMRWLPGRGVGVIALSNSTYAPMKVMTRRMLELIDDHGLIPAIPSSPHEALVAAGQRLADLLSNWTDQVADDLFADNVALDESFARRARSAADLVDAHGPLTLVDVAAGNPVFGRATMQHADGTVVNIDFDLSPLVPPRVQFYEVVTE